MYGPEILKSRHGIVSRMRVHIQVVVQKSQSESTHAQSFNANSHQKGAHAPILVAILYNQPEK